MKKTLLILTFGALVASCGTGGADQTMALQKKVDSMSTLLAATTNATDKIRMSTTDGFVAPPRMIGQEPKESYYIAWWKARQDIQRWHKYIWDPKHELIEDTARCSFIIPASNLRYLVDADSMNLDYVVFYLALDSAKMLTLVYEGGKIETGANGEQTLVEQPVHRKNGGNFAFDHAFPCPVCDKVGLTNPNGQ